MEYSEILKYPTFELNKSEKNSVIFKKINELTNLHYEKSKNYHQILDAIGFENNNVKDIEQIPFLPVSLFEELDLKSVSDDEIFKTMTSFGTTGQKVSKIYLDRKTASNQQKTLVNIVKDFTGSSRMPMLIIDTPSVLKDRNMFSARGAGILGFSIFGSDETYALKEDMSLDYKVVSSFLKKHEGKRIFLFGFTFMVWKYFFKDIESNNYQFDLSNAVMIHGGGWKKMLAESVSSKEFKQKLFDLTGIKQIYDYYGMVEQT